MAWKNKKILVTGGASFIGSHLVEALVMKAGKVKVVDNLSSGKLKNIRALVDSGAIEFVRSDLRNTNTARKAVKGIDLVFHLAADHGGRGYVDLHQAGPASNLFLDGLLFWEAVKAGVNKIVYASSGCVYPNHLQVDSNKKLFLREGLVSPPYDADNMYGWAKLMAEDTLRAYHKEYGIKAASCRYFAVYGPRGRMNQAVIAMIARAFVKQDPFEVWGDGNQIRNWTYIDDIVRGTILAGEHIDDGTGVNLGTKERTSVIDAVKMIMKHTHHNAKIKLLRDMPTGPVNRVADNALAKKLLGWEPQFSFREGIAKSIKWFYNNHRMEEIEIRMKLVESLTER